MKTITALPEKKSYKGWHNWSEVQIPDLWHIAQRQESQVAREAVLLTWHLAHDAKAEIERRSGLLEACKYALSRLVDGTESGTLAQCALYSDSLAPDADGDIDHRTIVDFLREVIAKAEGK